MRSPHPMPAPLLALGVLVAFVTLHRPAAGPSEGDRTRPTDRSTGTATLQPAVAPVSGPAFEVQVGVGEPPVAMMPVPDGRGGSRWIPYTQATRAELPAPASSARP